MHHEKGTMTRSEEASSTERAAVTSEEEHATSRRTYYDVSRAESESVYSSANETNEMIENPPAMRRRTWSPPSRNAGHDDQSP